MFDIINRVCYFSFIMDLSKKAKRVLEKLFNPHARGQCPKSKEIALLMDETNSGSYRATGGNMFFNRNGVSVTLNDKDDGRASFGEVKRMFADLNPFSKVA